MTRQGCWKEKRFLVFFGWKWINWSGCKERRCVSSSDTLSQV